MELIYNVAHPASFLYIHGTPREISGEMKPREEINDRGARVHQIRVSMKNAVGGGGNVIKQRADALAVMTMGAAGRDPGAFYSFNVFA